MTHVGERWFIPIFRIVSASAALLPMVALSAPIDPQLNNMLTYWRVECLGTATVVDPIPAVGVSEGQCIRESSSTGEIWQATAQTAVLGSIQDPTIPTTAARSRVFVDGSVSSAIATTKMAYGFSIQTVQGAEPPQFLFEIPMAVQYRTIVEADVNGLASTAISFQSQSYFWNPNNQDFTCAPFLACDVQFKHSDAIELAVASPERVTGDIWFGLLETDSDYWFKLFTSCLVIGSTATPDNFCNAVADPTVEFDQAAFDAMMGADTFLLADYYEVQYSPGFNAVPVPAALWLFASGLGLLAWIRRRARKLC